MQYLLTAYGAIWLFFAGYFALTLLRSLAAAKEIAAMTGGGEGGAPSSGQETARP